MTTTTESAATTPLVPITTHHYLPIKLTQKNYSSWRAHLIALLTGHDLLGYIKGSFKKPSLLPDGSNATEITHWVRQDNLLLVAIFGSLSPDILRLFHPLPRPLRHGISSPDSVRAVLVPVSIN
ncbi:hypothetical protein PHJA_002836600 [Phtheirospermum japonicum]|uniref:Retrotransposon Copia-like N-terminal domain-containing protein n=1 Tax=Phtheirospermum japonicum TaxID=374723 RepID=A0A830DJJ1_9LAMI|nr:hypothetical protein PHJA_002836600 [Phtheirospermum japonicum]